MDGSDVALMFPPQGGFVVFVGVRVRNMHACGAQLQGVLRDLTTNQLRLDSRTINLRPTADGGWGGSAGTNQATFANIPVCPNQWASTDIQGHEFELQVRVEDREDRVVQRTFRVRPYCSEPSFRADCECICRRGYVLGQACDVDGGAGLDGGSG